ncbi:MAG TPA: hypothetical protein VMD75_05815 [Candidatus Binataceae bacterium]|nr:hypothetical protein [Candidatus Binataceae bacterium]
MNRCLSDKVLLMLHEGEELAREREHLERCADCDRRYQRLVSELAEIVTILNEPLPVQHRAPRITSQRARLGLAFAAVVMAFLCGRLTVGTFGGQLIKSGPAVTPMVVSFDDSGVSPELPGGAIVTPASYGLYVDDLISTDDNDPSIGLPADNEAQDTDGF